ncbi:hypothetical protein IU450_34485 [Nocardia abscessus]|nr:hypothetical protein [Nocardia abscessus]MBF6340962.1 hypothetical protein [Nocardia abscessus]
MTATPIRALNLYLDGSPSRAAAAGEGVVAAQRAAGSIVPHPTAVSEAR